MSARNSEYLEIVVGSSLEALLYAFRTDRHVIFTNYDLPFEHDYFDVSLDFDFLNVKEQYNLTSQNNKIIYGPKKINIWRKLFFLLSMSGRIIFGDRVRSLKVEGDKLIVGLELSRRRKVSFSHLYIFDDLNITGLPDIERCEQQKSIVYDWANCLSSERHMYDLLIYKEDFVNQVYFYESKRVGRGIKDIVSVSFIQPERIKEFEFSETYVKFRLTQIFKELGIRGSRNGRDVDNPSRYKHYAVDIEPANRVIKHRKKNIYSDIERLTFVELSLEDICKMPNLATGYLSKITGLL